MLIRGFFDLNFQVGENREDGNCLEKLSLEEIWGVGKRLLAMCKISIQVVFKYKMGEKHEK